MLENWKTNNTDVEDAYKINSLNNYIRSLFISEHLKLELPDPTLAFVNLQEPEKDEWSKDFNNKRRLAEVKILEKHNHDNYKAIIFTNKTHYIFVLTIWHTLCIAVLFLQTILSIGSLGDRD